MLDLRVLSKIWFDLCDKLVNSAHCLEAKHTREGNQIILPLVWWERVYEKSDGWNERDKSTLTGKCPHPNLHLNVCLTQCIICSLLGLCLSSLLCTLCLFLLGGVPLIFNCRVHNVVGTGLDWSMGLSLLAVQVSPCYCCCLYHDGIVCIAGIIVCL
jgi:hypothetical protein